MQSEQWIVLAARLQELEEQLPPLADIDATESNLALITMHAELIRLCMQAQLQAGLSMPDATR